MTEIKKASSLKMPGVAWPTIILAIVSAAVWTGSFVFGTTKTLPIAVCVFFAFVAIFASFTPFHDAVHKSVSRTGWINEVIGRVLSVLWLVPFPVMRFVHIEHHRNTNDREKDPDYWSGSGSRVFLPFRWLTQDLHYCAFYFKGIGRRPAAEVFEFVLTNVLFLSIFGAFIWFGYWKEILLFGLLPNRLAVSFLAYSFDYLPHNPHQITSDENPFEATKIRPVGLLTPLLLYQNYHLIHHLYPAIPFYKYAKVWRERKEILIKKGAKVVDLFGRRMV
jgi:fatty acid desaturase